MMKYDVEYKAKVDSHIDSDWVILLVRMKAPVLIVNTYYGKSARSFITSGFVGFLIVKYYMIKVKIAISVAILSDWMS
jgi:hypothetical protein